MNREDTKVDMGDTHIIESKTLFIYNIVSLIIIIATIAMGVAYIQKDTQQNTADVRRIEMLQKEAEIHCERHDEDQVREIKVLEERIRMYCYQRSQENKVEIKDLKDAIQSNKESLIIYSAKIDSIETNIDKIARLLESMDKFK